MIVLIYLQERLEQHVFDAQVYGDIWWNQSSDQSPGEKDQMLLHLNWQTNSTFTITVIKIYFRWATEHHRLLLHCFNGYLWIWRNFVYSFNFEGVRMKSIITNWFIHTRSMFLAFENHMIFLFFFSFFGVIVNWNSLIYQKVREQPIRIQRVK